MLSRATSHELAAASSRVHLVQRPEDHGVLLALPIQDDREVQETGVVLAVLCMDSLLASATAGVDTEGLMFALVDVAPDGRHALSAAQEDAPGLSWSESVEFGGRNWEFRFSAPTSFLRSRPALAAWLVLTGGMLLTSALGGFLLLVTGRSILIERLATERAHELHRKDEEHEQIQDQLRHMQKLEVVGRLAGGVAHDLNNLLTVIKGYGELLGLELAGKAERTSLEEIRKATERAALLVQRLLAFARRQVMHPRRLDVNALIGGLRGTLLPLVGERVVLVPRLLSKGVVQADPGQLEQVVMNLVVNARDALLPEGGELRVETADVEVTPDDEESALIPPGNYVRIEVTDEGCGMPPEVLARVFEPFYTTKKDGTGLGLSTVYGIVQQSGGFVSVKSSPERGSTFRVYLPVAEGDVLVPAERRETTREHGRGTILVVEDEAALRALLCDYLAGKGYEVRTADSAVAAIALARELPSSLDVLLTDVIMPDLTGPEVVARVRESHPDVAVLYMSGYSGNAIESHGIASLEPHCLQKPFSLDELARQLHRLVPTERPFPSLA
jgi:hypothetical protein